MAKSKDDITYATSQARLLEDEAVRVAYKHGTPLEGGKIAESEPVDMFQSAHIVSKGDQIDDSNNNDQSQLQHDHADMNEGGSKEFTPGAPCLPKKGYPTIGHKF
ncbi:SEED MATURATION PROTEIN 1-like [Gastrolobium bilobum]|uniref:SEED MATURATION PROTEIN 1-like n=1 Tax=Gastrolobium bilobum TaxID=150636 RepID=UPI002AAF5298|nr:SEED MATURATION PROTEIN 1-like [Gastrolobium bilobum]